MGFVLLVILIVATVVLIRRPTILTPQRRLALRRWLLRH
jgi:hypothetical protein